MHHQMRAGVKRRTDSEFPGATAKSKKVDGVRAKGKSQAVDNIEGSNARLNADYDGPKVMDAINLDSLESLKVSPFESTTNVVVGSSSQVAPTERKVIVVLEQASLETVKTKKGFELINCDDHGYICKKFNRDPSSYRPDITHQLLLALLDSPLNKAGHLQIYIQTTKNVLIEVSSKTRIPRTYKRFAGLMVQLLHKFRVRSADDSETLLKVIKNPIQSHLPPEATVVGLEVDAELVHSFDLPAKLPSNRPVVFVIGAMSHGNITADYITRTFSLSQYPLSAACAVSKLLNAFEYHWKIL